MSGGDPTPHKLKRPPRARSAGRPNPSHRRAWRGHPSVTPGARQQAGEPSQWESRDQVPALEPPLACRLRAPRPVPPPGTWGPGTRGEDPAWRGTEGDRPPQSNPGLHPSHTAHSWAPCTSALLNQTSCLHPPDPAEPWGHPNSGAPLSAWSPVRCCQFSPRPAPSAPGAPSGPGNPTPTHVPQLPGSVRCAPKAWRAHCSPCLPAPARPYLHPPALRMEQQHHAGVGFGEWVAVQQVPAAHPQLHLRGAGRGHHSGGRRRPALPARAHAPGAGAGTRLGAPRGRARGLKMAWPGVAVRPCTGAGTSASLHCHRRGLRWGGWDRGGVSGGAGPGSCGWWRGRGGQGIGQWWGAWREEAGKRVALGGGVGVG